jgi:hypothetical protein
LALMCYLPRPNLSLNADVPHAGLRPGSGPPVSLVRWASDPCTTPHSLVQAEAIQ